MAKKTWKIGECCKGGILSIVTTADKVIVIGREWDYAAGPTRGSNQSNAKEWTRLEVPIASDNARSDLRNFLEDLTTSYYAGEILDWIETKVEFKTSFAW